MTVRVFGFRVKEKNMETRAHQRSFSLAYTRRLEESSSGKESGNYCLGGLGSGVGVREQML